MGVGGGVEGVIKCLITSIQSPALDLNLSNYYCSTFFFLNNMLFATLFLIYNSF